MKTSHFFIASSLALAIFSELEAATPSAAEKSLFPILLEMNQPLDKAKPRIENACASTKVMEYTGAMAAPYGHQTQINCFDLAVLGKPRKVEFMFNEGNLEFLWILLESDELGAVKDKLKEVFGEVVFDNGNDRVFASGTIALRTEPAEILIGTSQLVSEITGYQP